MMSRIVKVEVGVGVISRALQLDDVAGADCENSLYAFGQSEKRCKFNV